MFKAIFGFVNTECLRPIYGIVQLHDNSLVTVPVFNTKHIIMSLLTDSKLMNDQYFPDGYEKRLMDIPMINMGRFILVMHGNLQGIGFAKNDMPVALIVFGIKLNTDLHGALSLTPIIFTLMLLNQSA